MAWEWSHTNEAYHNAYENLHDCDMVFLAEALTEWILSVNSCLGTIDKQIESLILTDEYNDRENLADAVWKFASSYDWGRLCDNGGFNAWVCPHGCHTVSFDREDNDDV